MMGRRYCLRIEGCRAFGIVADQRGGQPLDVDLDLDRRIPHSDSRKETFE
jgi:hypothetical protein